MTDDGKRQTALAGVIEELTRLEREATPGRWVAAASPSSVVGWPIVAQTGRVIGEVAWMPHLPRDGAVYAETKANADLIAAMRNALPLLLSALQSRMEDRSQ